MLGHESIGRVLEAPSGGPLHAGDLVVGIVRRPDPVPCYACAKGEWDACRNGQYTEHGIKSLHGFMRERYRADAAALMAVDASLVAPRRADGADDHRRQGLGADARRRAPGDLGARNRDASSGRGRSASWRR